MLSTLSSKGQITLPKTLRDLCQLAPGDKIEFLLHEDGLIEIIPVTMPITHLKGMIARPTQPVSLEEMESAIRRRAGRS
ncbi:AbrB/MazE/SpoVT family DNA-binding domain-containing protein [Acidithiobacillus sp. MC6.1]|nr:AbrB/MazE/SpoVT family DNA-binding domain-containing protein [Acidithiobacillus sp. MC6.1]